MEVQVRRIGVTGVAEFAEQVTGADPLADRDRGLRGPRLQESTVTGVEVMFVRYSSYARYTFPSVPVTGTGSVVTLASTGVTSAGTLAEGAPPDVLTDVAVVVADELEFVREAESEADAAVLGAAVELSLVADCPVQPATSAAANPRVATVRSACLCIRAM